jgi:acyl-CoA thioesterase
MTQDTNDALARDCAAAMWADDKATQALGMVLEEVRSGYARISMTITSSMTNGHGIGHGGYTFLLADSSFAFACNSYNQRAVAASAAIDFLAATQLGDRLSAQATMRSQGKRAGIYDIEVRNQHGVLVALFRGKSATVKGQFFPSTSTKE